MRSLWVGVIAVIALTPVAACGESRTTSRSAAPSAVVTTQPDLDPVDTSDAAQPMDISGSTAEDVDFWSQFAMAPNWVELYPSIAAMTAAADVVVVANVRAVEPMPPIPGDVPGAEIERLMVRLDVVVDLQGDELTTVNLQLESPFGNYDEFVADLSGRLPTGSSYFALRLADAENDVYRIINGHSIWVSTPGGLHAPLHPNDDETEAVFGSEVAGLTSLQALVEYLRS